MSDPFDAFEANLNQEPQQHTETLNGGFEADPAAAFLAREEEEMARIEQTGSFGDFDSFAPSGSSAPVQNLDAFGNTDAFSSTTSQTAVDPFAAESTSATSNVSAPFIHICMI
jgi:hypothetical protein